MAVPTNFNIETAARDFAGPGREITRDERTSEFHAGLHIWVKVNGWTFSATWDRATYCSGARPGGNLGALDDKPEPVSPDAEIGVWRTDSDEGMIELHGDTVEGWVSPASFLAAIEAAERDDEDAIRAALVRSE
jgi:hypothetical protein